LNESSNFHHTHNFSNGTASLERKRDMQSITTGPNMRLVVMACLFGALLLCPHQTAGFLLPGRQQMVPLRKGITAQVGAVSTPQGKGEEAGQLPSTSKRARLLNKMGFKALAKDGADIRKAAKAQTPKEIFEIKTVEELEDYFDDKEGRYRTEKGEIDYDSLLRGLSVKGDTQIIGSKDHPEYVHPVAKLLHERKRNNSVCVEGERPDGCKVALVVEGGGMRGCISAGMVCAIHHLGLRETVDVIYGSSAGSMIGAYFNTGQLPWFGPEVYYDKLTTAGKEFIDTGRLLRSLGFGLVDPRLFKDVMTRPSNGKPVLNLPFLLRTTMQETKPLNWEAFVERQKVQPLKVVASALKSEKPFVMGMKEGHFNTFDELSDCMHASCLLPGIAGPIMNAKVRNMDSPKPKYIVANNLKDPDYEPLSDALIYGPMPYEAAFQEGATHAIVIRSRPDGTDVTGKGGVFEKLIMRRFFLRKNKLPKMFQRMSRHFHKKLYAKDVLELNKQAVSTRDYLDTSKPHSLTMALPPGSEEVARLEIGREAVFEGVRRGFARAYDALVEDPSERGRGDIVARQYFPDEILDYDPTTIERYDESAFSVFMEECGLSPKSWDEVFERRYTP
jgi:predicted acylesterase/phospholipase RssA